MKINVPHTKIDNTLFDTFRTLVFFLCTSDQQKENINIPEDHPMNIPTKFDSNLPSGFREEDWKQTKPFLTPLGIFFWLCTFDHLKNKLLRGPSNEYSYQVWYQLVQWFQRIWLKCKSLQLTTSAKKDCNTSHDPLGQVSLTLNA